MGITTDRKVRLLLVDDNPGDVQLFRWALRRADLDIDLSVIDDGGEALAMVREADASSTLNTPDLVVLDLNLPKADGREILTLMRSTRAFADVPVVILTSSTSLRDREQMESLNIARYIAKPPDLKEFMNLGSVVKNVLEETMGSGLTPADKN